MIAPKPPSVTANIQAYGKPKKRSTGLELAWKLCWRFGVPLTLSPYITRHIKRYGDYRVDLSRVPPPWEEAIPLPIEIPET
jgi:hypothetical protein